MRIPAQLKTTLMQRRFFELRFNRGLRQWEIAEMLRVQVPAISKREKRIRNLFVNAGLPEPIPPGRSLFSVSAHSL